jgi:hypothetical protein
MLFTIIGQTNKARAELQRIRSLLKKKQPDAEEIVIGEEAFSKEFLEERIASQARVCSCLKTLSSSKG